MLKKYLMLIATVTILLSSSRISLASEQLIDKAVAIANEEIILQSELDTATKMYLKTLESKGIPSPDIATLRKNVLDQLINQSLILQLAKKNGFDMSDTDIDRAIETMAQTSNKTVPQLIAEAEKNGYSEAEFRNTIKNNIITSEIKRSQVRGRINISDQEAEQLAISLKNNAQNVLSYHLANIFFKLDTNATPAQVDSANRRAKLVMNLLSNGESFSSLAQKYSEGPNVIEGGDIGTLNLNELPMDVAQAISQHNAGDVVGPLKLEGGIFIAKIYSIGHEKPKPIEQVKVRHILLTTNIIFDDDKAQEKLLQFKHNIINGDAKFDELARTYSQDPGSSFNGGLMDWMNPNVFDPRFRDALKTLEPGQMSEPFKSSFGWHLVLLEGRKIDTNSLEAYKIKAREILTNRSVREESDRWERELRDSSYVKILE